MCRCLHFLTRNRAPRLAQLAGWAPGQHGRVALVSGDLLAKRTTTQDPLPISPIGPAARDLRSRPKLRTWAEAGQKEAGPKSGQSGLRTREVLTGETRFWSLARLRQRPCIRNPADPTTPFRSSLRVFFSFFLATPESSRTDRPESRIQSPEFYYDVDAT